MAAQELDRTDYVLEAVAALFVVALIGMSVAGAFFSVRKYLAMRCVAAALAFGGDLAAISAFKKMVRRYGRRKGKFFASAACWIVLSCITVGSATLCLQWVFKVANKPQENHQQHVQTAQNFVNRVQDKLLSTDAKERKAAKSAAPGAQSDLSKAMSESIETVQHIANGNELWYILAIAALAYLLLYASGEDGKEEMPKELAAWLQAKDITAQAGAAPSLPMPPLPPKSKEISAKQ